MSSSEAVRRRRITPEVLRELAQVYRAHVDHAPTRAVKVHFGLNSDRTARWWVKRARAEGFLGGSFRGKAGELAQSDGRPAEDRDILDTVTGGRGEHVDNE